MKTDDTNDLLFAYVSGELNEEEARRVEARCASDPGFACELALTRAATRVAAAHALPDPDPFFWTRLSARLDAEEAPWQAWVWAAKRLIPSMVAVTLLVTAVMWQQSGVGERFAGSVETALLASGNGDVDEWLADGAPVTKDELLESAVLKGMGRSR